MADPTINALAPYQMPGSQPLAAAPPTNNFAMATNALRLNPQEQALYMRHLTNLYGSGGVDNPNGSRSTLYQMSTQGPDGRIYNVPTVWNGGIIDPDSPGGMQRIMANVQQAGGLAAFPSYASDFAAENRYQQMHNYMDRDTGSYFQTKGR